MLTRIITAVVALLIFIPVLVFSGTVVFPIVMALLSLIAAYEMISCVGMTKLNGIFVSAILFAGLAPMVPYLYPENAVQIIFALAIVFMITVFTTVVFGRGTIDYPFSVSVFTGVFYIGIAFASIVLLRGEGKYLYLLVFIGPWVSDTFAYFGGRLLGKHKLIPEVSPKKTVEGSVSGIVFTAAAFVLYAFIIKKFFDPDFAANYVFYAVEGAVVSVISQIGDLIASVIKRRFLKKDYGKIFPGHGGVMDRFDSVLLTAPVIYIISMLPFFNI